MTAAFNPRAEQFVVTTFTEGNQGSPGIGANPSTGGFQIVWQSDGQDGFFRNIYGRDFLPGGAGSNDEFSIADLTAGDQEDPDVVFNESGQGMWVWQSTARIQSSSAPDRPPVGLPEPNSIGRNFEVRSKTFGFEDTAGTNYNNFEVQRENAQATSAIDDNLIDITAISLGGDRFLTSWYSQDQDRLEYIHMVEAVTPDTVISTDTTGEISFAPSEPFGSTNWGDIAKFREIRPDRASPIVDEYLVVASRSDQFDGTGGVIQFQIFQENPIIDLAFLFDTRLLTDYNDQFVLENSGQTGSATHPHVVVLNDGGFVITWQERNETAANEANWHVDVYAQVFNDDFTPRSELLVVDAAPGSDQTLPEIVAMQDGGFAVAWNDGAGGTGDDVMLQRFNAQGWKLGREVMVNNQTAGDQNDVALDILNNGNLAVTWESSQGDGDGTSVMARVMLTQGYGNARPQYIEGTSAGERIAVGQGADTVKGGLGADVLVGARGRDILRGENGADNMDGGIGNDLVDGGNGADTATGGDGNDTLLGGAGNDLLNGNIGADSLAGGSEADTLNGGQGADTLNGGNGADVLNGGRGRDVLNGGRGGDEMTGGVGEDTFFYGIGRDTITDFEDNIDTLQISRSLAANKAALAALVDEQADRLVFDFGGNNVLTVIGVNDFDAIRVDDLVLV